jgi:hypothetical protein
MNNNLKKLKAPLPQVSKWQGSIYKREKSTGRQIDYERINHLNKLSKIKNDHSFSFKQQNI